MAKLVIGMMQSLDGYVAGIGNAINIFIADAAGSSSPQDSDNLSGAPDLPPPGPELGKYFNDRSVSTSYVGEDAAKLVLVPS